eukprot:5183816-Pyramimonas_sp.AAC.1
MHTSERCQDSREARKEGRGRRQRRRTRAARDLRNLLGGDIRTLPLQPSILLIRWEAGPDWYGTHRASPSPDMRCLRVVPYAVPGKPYPFPRAPNVYSGGQSSTRIFT